MVVAKLILAASIIVTASLSANAGHLYINDLYSQEDPNGSSYKQISVVMNQDTPAEELLIMGMYTVYNEKSNTKTVTMFMANKKGYQASFSIKLLMSFVG